MPISRKIEIFSPFQALLVLLLLSACAGPSSADPQPVGAINNVNATSVVLPNTDPCSTQGQEQALRPAYRGDVASQQGAPVYTLTVESDILSGRYHGHERICYTNRAGVNLPYLLLRLYANRLGGTLDVSQLKVNGEVAESKKGVDLTYLEVALKEPLLVHAQAIIEMDYTGTVALKTGPSANNGYSFGQLMYTNDVFSLSNFYPQMGVWEATLGWNTTLTAPQYTDPTYAEASFFNVILHLPGEQKVLGVGVEVETKESEDKRMREHHFVTGPVREFAAVMSSQYAIETQTVDGITYTSAYLPAGEEDARQEARRVLRLGIEAIQAFDHFVGPYPYARMSYAETPIFASGIEKPTLSSIAFNLYQSPLASDEFDMVITHETAHNWWYGLVGDDQIGHSWIDEGTTVFMTAMQGEFTAQLQGKSASEIAEIRVKQEAEILDRLKSYYKLMGKDIILDEEMNKLILQVDDLKRGMASEYAPYYKAASMYIAYRKLYGDQAILTCLQTLFQTHKYQIAQPTDILKAMQVAAPGHDDAIQVFFHRWTKEAMITQAFTF